MILTSENYFSPEANREYLSVSQYKEFAGCIGRPACEAKALSKLNGEWQDDNTTALLVGSYVDAHFEGTLDVFRAQNPEIFTRQGALKAEYRHAEEIINRLERDELFMQYMSGQKQVIMTGELFGVKWKIKIDSYLPGKAVVDLKIMKAIRGKDAMFYIRDCGSYVNFAENWGYDIQGAIYQEIVYQNTGKRLPFYIAAASKEKEPDIAVIYVPDSILKERLADVEKNAPNILALKKGEMEPIRCEQCDYCKHTRVLTQAIHWDALLGEV